MTSIASESVATILCSCKQTRFHIENPNYRELDIEGLNITVTSADKATDKKGKAKATKGDGIEILSNAKLRLKAGQRYALVGRNGSGKSTLLRAIAERLIPGIPEETRIAILQQTNAASAPTGNDVKEGDAAAKKHNSPEPTVLEDIIDKATARSELEQEIKVLADGVSSNHSYATARALRTVRHERLQKKLFVLDKDARLRSGTRGMAARKALTAFEKVVAESQTLLDQDEHDISPDTLQREIQEAADLLADLQLQVEPAKLATTESRAKKILAGLGFSEAQTRKPLSSLSGGWQMRAALAAALLQETDILILDEPTNYLDLLGIIWLQRHLRSLSEQTDAPTLILVSHDRDFVSLATDLLILKDKGLAYFHGDLPTYEASQSERRLYLAKMREAQDKQRQHIQETIARNIKAGRKNDDENKLRQAKSRQKKLDDRWGMQVNANGRKFKLNRDMVGFHNSMREQIDVPPDERAVVVALPAPAELRFPGPLVGLEAVTFRYRATRDGAGKKVLPPLPPPVLDGVALSVHLGDRIGILGLNGAGKSTLIKLLVQSSAPTSGTVAAHPRLKVGYYSQHAVEDLQRMASGEPGLTALSLLMREVDGGELDEGEVRGLLASLGLAGRTVSDVPVGKLSGGQLVRCELARLLWRRPQLLVLDEVTTHLDYETVTALREALRSWEGAVVLVSHDRWFMRGVVEGAVDEDEEGGSSEESEDEAEANRRREVYRLRGGKLVKLPGGVGEFEDIMERRVRKMAAG